MIQYKRAEVLHDYKAQDAEELNLKKGDMIKDIIELENGWWQVYRKFVHSKMVVTYMLVLIGRS